MTLPGTGAVSGLSLGTEFSCALRGGNVYCWGGNNWGQLGNSLAIRESADPLPVSGLGDSVTVVSAGSNHACAVVSGGAWCWGDNGDGQLGSNVGSVSEVAVAVDGLSSGVRSVGAGERHSCALLDTGEVRCWGENHNGQLGVGTTDPGGFTPRTVIGISAATLLSVGGFASCVVVNGRAWCWGSNDLGQLGNGVFSDGESTPQAVVGLTGVDRIVMGRRHSCVIAEEKLWCWGDNSSGVLANGTRENSAIPVHIPIASGAIEDIALGGGEDDLDSQVTCAAVDGLGYCWGATNSYPDAVRKEVWSPQLTTIMGTVTGLSAGTLGHTGTCAMVDGDLRCWGRDWGGRLGQAEQRDTSEPVGVEGLSSGAGVTMFSIGFLGGCAVVNGGARCWGRGSYLGNGTSFNGSSEVPVSPTGLDSNVSDISAGNSVVCAVVNGGVMCWGLDGALGNGPANDGGESLVPVWVTGMGPSSGVTDVTVGNQHACAVQNGAVYCWGTNIEGELGDGNQGVSSNVPVSVIGLSTGVEAVEAGIRSTCARTNTGAVYCWGQVIADPKDVPVLIPGLEQDVTDMALGGFSACAIQLGALKCWGANDKGQLGTGDTESSDTPQVVQGLPQPVEHVTVGGVYYRGFVCAVAGGALYCWGDNSDRQLAIGLPLSVDAPALIAPWE